MIWFLSVVNPDGTPFPATLIHADYEDMVAVVCPDPPIDCKIIRTYVDRRGGIELSTSAVVEEMMVL